MTVDKINYKDTSISFYQLMKNLYNGAPLENKINTFADVMKNNLSRSDFILELINSNNLSEEEDKLLSESKEFIINFIMGKFNRALSVNEKFINDKDNNGEILSKDEFRRLMNLLKASNQLYKEYSSKDVLLYDKNNILIEKFSLTKDSLTNVIGLSEYQIKDDNDIKKRWDKFIYTGRVIDYISYASCKDGKKPNLLYKHYFLNNNIKDLTQFYDYIISDEGIDDLTNLYQEFILFTNEDKKNNPYCYDDGHIDSKKATNFQQNFYNYIKNKYYNEVPFSNELIEYMKRQYPLLKTSKYYVYTYMLINFFNMNNVFTLLKNIDNNYLVNNMNDYASMMVINNHKVINSICPKRDDFKINDPIFIDKVSLNDDIVRISSIEDELIFERNYGFDKENEEKLLNRKKLLNEVIVKKDENVDSFDELINRYTHIANIIIRAINDEQIIINNNSYEIYESNHLITIIDFDNMKLLGVFAGQYLNNNVINNYLQKNEIFKR